METTIDAEQKKKERKKIGQSVRSVYDFLKQEHEKEASKYIKAYRHEFDGILPDVMLKSNRVDVNVIFPIVKALIPNLYFQDPKVIVKSLQEKIIFEPTEQAPIVDPVTGLPQLDNETGEPVMAERPVMDDAKGVPVRIEYDGQRSALILQNALNNNIRNSKLKNQYKSCILDAHLTFYGALKTGWDNEQGVYSMGADAPPSPREDIFSNMAYGIRLKPWDVIVDMNDFYNPEWIALRYVVNPEKLKKDTRLSNTEDLKGNAEMDVEKKKSLWRHLDKECMKFTEYFEFYRKPCAEYPEGQYLIFTDEVPEAYLYEGVWPYKAKGFPVKILYFIPDPDGGLPVPPVRYYANQQKAKTNLRNVLYEWVQRTLGILGIDANAVDTESKKQITSGQIPRVVMFNRNPNSAVAPIQFPGIPPDFHRMDGLIDQDIAREAGQRGVYPAGNPNAQFSSDVKASDRDEQIKMNEQADVVRDSLRDVVIQWAQYYQEFGGSKMLTPIEGEKFPTEWSVDQIQGQFNFDIKPFSMNYEDPVILRRQWVDLLNILSAPELKQLVSEQGAKIDIVKVINRILETYGDRDVESFLLDGPQLPENQVAQAIEENQAIAGGAPHHVMPTDNHKIHILVHGVLGDAGLEAMMEHKAALDGVPAGSPGGGNKEGMPINGVATKQDQLREPLQPNMKNKATAIQREGTKTR